MNLKKLIIIDGNSLINRAFYALPPLTASDGTPSQAVYGFTTMIIKLITEHKPDYFAVAFDMSAPTFRHKECDFYKATRKGMPDELAVQLAPLKKLLKLMNIRCIEQAGFEADDIIGTIVKKCEIKSIIVTGDRDSLQLVDDNISVMLTKRGITEVLLVDKNNFENEIGLKPSQIIDYKALCGDSSDNIPGVAGVGDKTAINLLRDYDTIDNIYSNIEGISGSLKTKLIIGKESAYISKRLATIETAMELDCELNSFTFDFPFSEDVRNNFSFLGFRSLLKRNELFGVSEKSIASSVLIKNKITTEKIESKEHLMQIFKRHVDTLSFFYEDNIYFSFDENQAYEVVLTADLLGNGMDFFEVINLFAHIFERNSIKKVVFDVKGLKKLLKKRGICLVNFEDVKLMQYLVDMSIDYSSPKKLIEAYSYIEGGAAAFYTIYKRLLNDLNDQGMRGLYYDIELPLIEVLFSMEEEGIKVDIARLEELGKDFSAKMRHLTEKIYKISGCEFNVNSPKQLADILFNKLQIPYPVKSKSYSTNAEILQSVTGDHEIIDCVLEYRTYFKLNNTYIDGIRKLAGFADMVHTEFKQMLTTTGRLSSVEPNLQNIPIRDDEGKVLREIFVSQESRTLVSADYSQIELRLLAHCSGDEKLIKAYKNNEDIHSSTAAEVFSVKISEVTSSMRRDAKAVNFGIIYGISDFGLAKNLKISRYQAKKYIETYFEKFSSVKQYLNGLIESAKKFGYAETLLGRKRKIPELFSSNYNMRSFGERAAMNMPLQGTAADIVKIAMLNVFNALKGKKSRLILQVHDELIIDAYDDELEEIKVILKESMMGAINLKVPLEVNISSGKRWSDCK